MIKFKIKDASGSVTAFAEEEKIEYSYNREYKEGNKIIAESTECEFLKVQLSAELAESEVAQIVDVIQGQTDYSLDNIKIFPVE